MGLASVAAHRLGGIIPVGAIFKASVKIGQLRAKGMANRVVKNPLIILPATEPKTVDIDAE